MQAAGSVSAYFAGLVHPPARRDQLQQLQQQDFIASKLTFVALALGGAPIFLATRGAPAPGEAGIFALVLLQLVPVMMVTRRGLLAPAQELGVVGLLGVGLLAALLPAVHPLAAAAWFAAAAAEALVGCQGAAGRILAACGMALAAAAAACSTLASAAMPPQIALLAATAALPILAAVWRGRRIVRAATTAAAGARRRQAALAMLDGAVVIDADAAGLVGQASPNCSARFGIAGDDLRGRGLFERILVADRPAFLKLVSDAAHGTEAVCATLRLRCLPASPADAGSAAPNPAAPRHVAVEMRAVPDRDGVILLMRDAEVMQAADAARVQSQLEAAMRSRDGVIAGIGHDLRAPLNAVIGFSEILASQTLRPAGAEKQREYAQIILASGQQLLAMVDAILDLSKGQAGDLEAQARAAAGSAVVAALPPQRDPAASPPDPSIVADPALRPAAGGDARASGNHLSSRRLNRDFRIKRSA